MNRFTIADTFFIKSKNIAVIQVLTEEVDKFPIKVDDSVVNDDGEGYNVLEIEWFYASSIPTKYRSVAVVLDRMPQIGERVRLFKTCTFGG